MALPASDNFNRADGALGANWTTPAGFDPFAISANRARPPAGTAVYAWTYWSADSFAPSHYSQVTIANIDDISQYVGVSVRAATDGTAKGYFLAAYAGTYELRKVTGFGTSTLLAGSLGTPAVNDIIRLEATGNILTARINGVAVAVVSDTSYATGAAGLFGYTAAIQVDNWTASNGAGAAAGAYSSAYSSAYDSGSGATPPTIVVPCSWFQQQPAMVRKHTRLGAAYQMHFAGAPVQRDDGRFGATYEVRYPDIVSRKRRTDTTQRSIFAPQIISPVTPGRLTSYPDWIYRKRLVPYRQWFHSLGSDVKGTFVNELSWKPTYPDRIYRPLMHPSQPQMGFDDFQQLQSLTPLSWEPYYPDWIPRLKTLTANQPSFTLGSFGTISIPGMGWEPYYPDWLTPRKYRPSESVINVNPIPNPALVDLSWKPTYVDFATQKRIHPANITPSWWDTITIARTPYEWQMVQAIPVRRVLRPKGLVVSGQFIVPAAPFAWEPDYPDYIRRRQQPQRPTKFAAPPGTESAVSQYGWTTVYPSRLIIPIRRALIITPQIVPLQSVGGLTVDCIKLKDQKSSYSTAVNLHLWGSKMVDVSVTMPSPEGEVFC